MTQHSDFDGLPRELDPFENDWPWFPPQPQPNGERGERPAHPIDVDHNETGRPL